MSVSEIERERERQSVCEKEREKEGERERERERERVSNYLIFDKSACCLFSFKIADGSVVHSTELKH